MVKTKQKQGAKKKQIQKPKYVSKEVPVGVKIIAVLYYIAAVLFLLGGIVLLFGAGAIGTLVEANPMVAVIGAGGLVIAGIILIALAVLFFFVGKDLWKAQNWARIIAIVFAAIGILMALTSLIQGDMGNIISLIIHGIIGGYLLFNNAVKKTFS